MLMAGQIRRMGGASSVETPPPAGADAPPLPLHPDPQDPGHHSGLGGVEEGPL